MAVIVETIATDGLHIIAVDHDMLRAFGEIEGVLTVHVRLPTAQARIATVLDPVAPENHMMREPRPERRTEIIRHIRQLAVEHSDMTPAIDADHRAIVVPEGQP